MGHTGRGKERAIEDFDEVTFPDLDAYTPLPLTGAPQRRRHTFAVAVAVVALAVALGHGSRH